MSMEAASETSRGMSGRSTCLMTLTAAKGSERQISRSGPEQARVASRPWPLLLARIRMTVDEINTYQ
jgi:hypothetical protein